jgi:hypothetical protein
MSTYYKLTTIDVAAMRKADRLCVAFNDCNDSTMRRTSVRLIKDARKSEADPFAVDQEHLLGKLASVWSMRLTRVSAPTIPRA